MARAGKQFGNNLCFKIDPVGTTAASTICDISDHVLSVDGLPGEREMADVTCGGGSVAHAWLPGMVGADITLECLFDQTTGTAWDCFLSTAYMYTADTHSRSFEYYPAGATTGYPKFSGECRVKSVTVPAKPLEPITFSVSLVLDSTLTITTA